MYLWWLEAKRCRREHIIKTNNNNMLMCITHRCSLHSFKMDYTSILYPPSIQSSAFFMPLLAFLVFFHQINYYYCFITLFNTYTENTRMEIIIKHNMLQPTVLYLTRTVYRERDRMAWEFALTRAKLSLPKISLLMSDLGLGRPCLVDKRVASLDSACIASVPQHPYVSTTRGYMPSLVPSTFHNLLDACRSGQPRQLNLLSHTLLEKFVHLALM